MVQISKDEALIPLLTVGLLFIFVHLSCYFRASIVCPSCNFENSQLLSDSTNITGSSKLLQKQGYKSSENHVPVCISRDASMECLLAGGYGWSRVTW